MNILYSLTNCVSVFTLLVPLSAPLSASLSIAVLIAVVVPAPVPVPASSSFSSSSSSSSSHESSLAGPQPDSLLSSFQCSSLPPPSAFSAAYLALQASCRV